MSNHKLLLVEIWTILAFHHCQFCSLPALQRFIYVLRFQLSPPEALTRDNIVQVLVDDTVNIRLFNVISLPFTGGNSGDTCVSSLLVLLTSRFSTFCLHFKVSVIALLKLGLNMMYRTTL